MRGSFVPVSGGPRAAALLLVGVLWLGGCAERTPDATPSEAPSSRASGTGPAARELRFAVSAMLSPALTYDAYAELLRGVARHLGMDYRFVQRRTYAEVNELLLAGEVDLAFICSGAYADLPASAPVELVAAPVVNGEAVYHSVIIVREDSPYRKFEDLRGARFAFTDPLSNTGHFYPRYRLTQLGETPDGFFQKTLFTGSHDRSIVAVYRQLVDAAAVDELVFSAVVRGDSTYQGRIRVIERSPDFANPPVVAPSTLPAATRARIRAYLIALSSSPEGRRGLAAAGMEGFVQVEAPDYEPIRDMIHAVQRKEEADAP